MPPLVDPDHILDLYTPSEPRLSRDGSILVFAKTTINRETMERESRIIISRRPFDELLPLTDGPSDSAPAICGAHAAFLRPNDRGAKQVWTVPLTGGEPRQIGNFAAGVEDMAWSPTGGHFAIVSTAHPDDISFDDQPDFPRARVVRRIRYRHDSRGYTGDSFRHLFILDAESGHARQLTDGEGDNWSPTWSPSGESIAFISDDIDGRDLTTHTQVKVTALNRSETVSWSEGLPYVWAVAWSPDGQSLAAIGCHDPEMWDPRSAWLYVLDAKERPIQITDGQYTPVPECGLVWTRERGIVFVGARRGEYFVCTIQPDGRGFTPITAGRVQYDALALDENAVQAVVQAESPDHPAELSHIDLGSGAQQAITSFSSTYLSAHPPARMEKFTINRSGLEIESRLSFPHDFVESKRYPMVLDIHGGPNGRFSDRFDPVHQILTANGYIVLAVNPRGSSSYGPEFTKSVLGDWGGEDYLDILAAVDHASARPYVDEDRMAVHGFSYGGFMSGWIVGHDHRFKAAVIGAMCANLHSMYGTSDIGVSFGEINWGGAYTNTRDKFLHHSPITYAENVETPVLLLHGEDDLRCPIEQSEQYFTALKRQGKTVEFVRFPNSTHRFRAIGHPKLIIEYYERTLDWLERHMGVGPT